MNTKIVMQIVCALIVAAISAVVAGEIAGARFAGETEQRVHAVERRLDKHEQTLDRIVPLLERIDERGNDVTRRLERVETKIDEQPKRRK